MAWEGLAPGGVLGTSGWFNQPEEPFFWMVYRVLSGQPTFTFLLELCPEEPSQTGLTFHPEDGGLGGHGPRAFATYTLGTLGRA